MPVKKRKTLVRKRRAPTKKVILTSRNLAKEVARIASDHKADDIVVLDLTELATFADYFIICSGKSDRQVLAIADAIHSDIKKMGRASLGEEGMQAGHWAIIDFGDVVVHTFYHELRDYYQLDRLWRDAKRIKFKGIG